MADLDLDMKGFAQLAMKFDQLPAEVNKDMGRTMLESALLVESTAKQNCERNFHGVGTLAASIGHKILKISGRLAYAATVGTNLVYAQIHEFGGVINPKNVKWLTIPFEGVKGRARDYTETFFRWVNGKLILFKREGNKIRGLFVLVKQVTVPARPYLNPALDQHAERIGIKVNEAVGRGLERLAKL